MATALTKHTFWPVFTLTLLFYGPLNLACLTNTQVIIAPSAQFAITFLSPL